MKKLFANAKHWHKIAWILACYDLLAVFSSYTLALLLRFDLRFSQIPAELWASHLKLIGPYMILCVIIFWFFKLYNSIWRFASYHELIQTIQASIAVNVILFATTFFTIRMPISYYFFGAVCQFCLVIGVRFSYRFVLLIRSRSVRTDFKHHVMVYGAGQAGQELIRDIINGGSNDEDKICCILDDNSNKWGRYIENIPIYGGREQIFEAVEKYKIDRIYFAIPTATAEQKRDILQICNETGCEIKRLPGIYQLVNGEVSVKTLRDVPIEDLLGREPIRADLSEVFAELHDKVVLVTGGGGSIGSELCRQVAACGPKQLIIFDVYENNAYAIQLELRRDYPNLNLVTLIGSVRDSRRVNQIFKQYRPEYVYHAAAHKHVPLMEDSPCEAIKNNVFGTYKVCRAALRYGTKRFVLISTDKAVNPTNIMGASKRMCEMVIQTFDHFSQQSGQAVLAPISMHTEQDKEEWYDKLETSTRFVAVRFGNVLGSNGSVVPIFKAQIEKGGPVTVTHPDIIRYFMTVPEAVSLVMLAGTYAKGGEIFVLDMGSPVKIDTLARNLIRLSGYKPDVDIKIEYTGLRSGEKLYEEKLMAEEGLKKTENNLIHIGKPIPFDYSEFITQLNQLKDVIYDEDETRIRDVVRTTVSTYHPQ